MYLQEQFNTVLFSVNDLLICIVCVYKKNKIFPTSFVFKNLNLVFLYVWFHMLFYLCVKNFCVYFLFQSLLCVLSLLSYVYDFIWFFVCIIMWLCLFDIMWVFFRSFVLVHIVFLVFVILFRIIIRICVYFFISFQKDKIKIIPISIFFTDFKKFFRRSIRMYMWTYDSKFLKL